MTTFAIATLLPAVGVLIGMLVCLELGRWIGVRRKRAEGELDEPSAGTVDAAIFALFGLLIAFTFSSAAGRFDQRRVQIVTETNAIGTAYLRIDLLPVEAQAPLRELFRDYLESRLATFQKLPDVEAARIEYGRSLLLQGDIWSTAIAAARSTGNPAVLSLVASSLNEMFDITTARLAATRMHVPQVILALLYGLALAVALVVGYEASASSRRNWFRTLLFPLVIAGSIYIILDLEHPRLGVVRIDAADQLLEELLRQMK
jgi:hypothetical protein